MICKIKGVYILLAFLLITMILLIAVGTFCWIIKHSAKQKDLQCQ